MGEPRTRRHLPPIAIRSRPYVRGRYPWTPVWDPTPDEFEAGLVEAKSFLEQHGQPDPIVTINAWNEWTEGSSLLPDTQYGEAFLAKIREVFGVV